MELENKKYWLLIIAISIASGSFAYWATGTLTDEKHSGKEIFLENKGKQVKMENTKYTVVDAKYFPQDNTYKLEIRSWKIGIHSEQTDSNGFKRENSSPNQLYKNREGGSGVAKENTPTVETLEISADTYDLALKSPVIIKKTTNDERAGSIKWLFSLSVSIGAFGILTALHLRKPKTRGEAATLLLENGRDDARIRDVEILATIMKMKKFTIPKVMKKVGTSKTTTYRTINEFIDMGLVEKTGEEKPLDGSRGKPSEVYRFVEEKE